MPNNNYFKTFSHFMENPEEMEAYAEPSIMDDYIKQNNPEEWDKIELARNLKFANEMGTGSAGGGGMMGTIKKTIGKNPLAGASPMGKFKGIYKDTPEEYGKIKFINDLIQDANITFRKQPKTDFKFDKTRGLLKPPSEDIEQIGQVIKNPKTPEKIGEVKHIDYEPQDYGRVITPEELRGIPPTSKYTPKTTQTPMTLEERVDKASEKEGELFKRLLELTGRKNTR